MVERRRHLMLVTRHTEYHMRGRECVGVRDRSTGKWDRWHGVLRTRLVGSVQPARIDRAVKLGSPLLFVGAESFVTSKVVAARRPPRAALGAYSSLVKSGAIG